MLSTDPWQEAFRASPSRSIFVEQREHYAASRTAVRYEHARWLESQPNHYGRIPLALDIHRKAVVVMPRMVFDLLHFDGASLLQVPYEIRRIQLEGLHLESEHWQTPPSFVGNGQSMLQASKEQGLEGVVAKRLGSGYEPGKRTGVWTPTPSSEVQ